MKDKNKGQTLQDIFKNTLSLGIAAAFMTEEAVKKLLQEAPLPKKVVKEILSQAFESKERFNAYLYEEVQKHLQKVSPKSLINSLLKDHDIKMEATFSLVPKKKPGKNK